MIDAFSIDGFVARDRLGALIGARFVSLDGDSCVYEYEVDEGHFNPGGMLHGGALYTVMDSTQGMLVYAVLESPKVLAATGTATIKYLAPVRAGTIVVRTTIPKREGRKLFVHSEAVDGSGVTVAVLDAVWITMLPKAA